MPAPDKEQPRQGRQPGPRSIVWELRRLVLTAALPLVVLAIAQAYLAYREAGIAAQETVLRQAARVVSEVTSFLGDTERTLRLMAGRPGVAALDPAHCDPGLRDLIAIEPRYANVTVIDRQGWVICGATPAPGGPRSVNVSDRDWFQAVMAGKPFALGKVRQGPILGRWVSTAAVPIPGAGGEIRGIVSTAIELERWGSTKGPLNVLPADSALGVMEKTGRLVLRSPEPEKWVGRDVSKERIFSDVMRAGEAVFVSAGVQGFDRVWAVKPIPDTEWMAFAGLRSDAILAAPRRQAAISLGLILALLITVAALSRLATRRLAHSISNLASTAAKAAAGDSAARANLSGPAEIASVAQGFNRMLDLRDQNAQTLRESAQRSQQLVEDLTRSDAETKRLLRITEGSRRALLNTLEDQKRVADALRQSEQKYRQIVENSPDIVYSYSMTKGGLYYSKKVMEVLGYSADQLCADPFLWAQSIHPDDRVAVAQELDELKKGGSFKIEYRIRNARDEWRWLFDRSTGVRQQGGDFIVDGLAMDITERKQAADLMRASETRSNTIIQTALDGFWLTDLQGQVLQVNAAYCRMSGYSEQELLGKTIAELEASESASEAETHLKAILARGWDRFETRHRRKDGGVFDVEVSVQYQAVDGGRMVCFLTDITQRKHAEEEIQSLAFFDPLTGLPNRRLLIDRLDQALIASVEHLGQGALLFVDLDEFKILNDTLGHVRGDQVLQQVATRLVECLRQGDTVARLGADEFAVLLEKLDQSPLEAAMMAETVGNKVMAALREPYNFDGFVHHATSSIGISLFGGAQREDTVAPLKRAELAMFRAKADGRNRLRFFDIDMQDAVSARVALEAGLHDAIENNLFLLHYQPQVSDQGRITGAEALLRWDDPKRGMVPPAEFIPLAEETGLILPIGNWVLQTACKQLAQWARQSAMAHLTISVNVSAKQFLQRDFVDYVLGALDRAGADAKRLKIELTESVLIANIKDIIVKMDALKARGVGFSLDDFGTGYSSLSYLKRLPLDQLKIDQGFVRDILVDPNDAAIARMVVALADSLGLTVVAEGVETQAQRDFLAALGCHHYQGYLFSRPLPIDEFEAFVARV